MGHAGPVGHSERSVQRLQPSSKFDSKVQIYSWVLLGDGFVFVVLAVPPSAIAPPEGCVECWGSHITAFQGASSRCPVADAQCRARPAIATPSDGRCWDRRPPWLIQIGGCRSQSSAMMVCSFLRLPFQVPRHSLPSRPQRGEAAPKRAFCFGRRVLTSMCVALADHTEMGCAT